MPKAEIVGEIYSRVSRERMSVKPVHGANHSDSPQIANTTGIDKKWYKELIFVDSFVRHGYHRNAKIEEIDSDNTVC